MWNGCGGVVPSDVGVEDLVVGGTSGVAPASIAVEVDHVDQRRAAVAGVREGATSAGARGRRLSKGAHDANDGGESHGEPGRKVSHFLMLVGCWLLVLVLAEMNEWMNERRPVKKDE